MTRAELLQTIPELPEGEPWEFTGECRSSLRGRETFWNIVENRPTMVNYGTETLIPVWILAPSKPDQIVREPIKPGMMFTHYYSTYCQHEDHENCRMRCKTCRGLCKCECHSKPDHEKIFTQKLTDLLCELRLTWNRENELTVPMAVSTIKELIRSHPLEERKS